MDAPNFEQGKKKAAKPKGKAAPGAAETGTSARRGRRPADRARVRRVFLAFTGEIAIPVIVTIALAALVVRFTTPDGAVRIGVANVSVGAGSQTEGVALFGYDRPADAMRLGDVRRIDPHTWRAAIYHPSIVFEPLPVPPQPRRPASAAWLPAPIAPAFAAEPPGPVGQQRPPMPEQRKAPPQSPVQQGPFQQSPIQQSAPNPRQETPQQRSPAARPSGAPTHPAVLSSAALNTLLIAAREGAYPLRMRVEPPESYSNDPRTSFDVASHWLDAVGASVARLAAYLPFGATISVDVSARSNRSDGAVGTVTMPERAVMQRIDTGGNAAWWRSLHALFALPLPLPQHGRFLVATPPPGAHPADPINPAFALPLGGTTLPAIAFFGVAAVFFVRRYQALPDEMLGLAARRPGAKVAMPGIALVILAIGLVLLLRTTWPYWPSPAALSDGMVTALTVLSFVLLFAGAGGAAGWVLSRYLPGSSPAAEEPRPQAATGNEDSATQALRMRLRTILYRDAPIDDIVDDKLGFAPLVTALAKLLNNRDTRPPLVIGVNGPWGSGKSSLMKMLDRELVGTGRFQTAWFNAWEYHREEQILAAFLQTVAAHLTRSWGAWFAARLALARFRRLTVRQYLLLGAPFALLFVGIYDPSLLKALADQLKPLFDDKATTTAALQNLTSAAGLGWLGWLTRFLLPFRLPFQKLAAAKDQSVRIGFINEFRREFDLYREALGDRKFVIFIDDMDRCQPDKVIDVLKAINLIVTGEGGAGNTFFVLGYDSHYVVRAINLAFKDFTDKADLDGERFGAQYLKKMVTLSVSVPRPKERLVTAMIARLDEPKSQSGAAIVSGFADRVRRVVNYWRKSGSWLHNLAMAMTLLVVAAAAVTTLAPSTPQKTEAQTAVANAPAAATAGSMAAQVRTIKGPDMPIEGWTRFDLPILIVGGLSLLVILSALGQSALTSLLDETDRYDNEDSATFKQAIEGCAPLLPTNPRDVVRIVNLMRLIHMVQAPETFQAVGIGDIYDGSALSESESVYYTVLQNRHPAFFDPRKFDGLVGKDGRIEVPESVRADLARLKPDGNLLAPEKLARYLDVNHYTLAVADHLKSPANGAAEDKAAEAVLAEDAAPATAHRPRVADAAAGPPA